MTAAFTAPGRGSGRTRIGLLPRGGRDWIAGTIVSQNLADALHLLPEDERPEVFLIAGPGQSLEDYETRVWMPPVKRFTCSSTASRVRKVMSTVRHHGLRRWPTTLERLIVRERISAIYPVFSPLGPGFPCSWISWIPDFQHRRTPQFFSPAELSMRDAVFTHLIEHAPKVVVSSQDARGDLLRWFAADERRIAVLPFATVPADDWFTPEPATVARRLGLPEKFLIFPSQFWMHKNHRGLFEAIRLAADVHPDIALVCTGRAFDYRHPAHAGSILQEAAEGALKGRVHCVGLLDRHSQIQLVRRAVAIVQPSFFEGWSALVEDARALGKRLYLSDLPVHREQSPPDAWFFDPDAPAELAALLIRDWSSLTPGPDADAERAAREGCVPRAQAFARRFLAIVAEAQADPRPRAIERA